MTSGLEPLVDNLEESALVLRLSTTNIEPIIKKNVDIKVVISLGKAITKKPIAKKKSAKLRILSQEFLKLRLRLPPKF